MVGTGHGEKAMLPAGGAINAGMNAQLVICKNNLIFSSMINLVLLEGQCASPMMRLMAMPTPWVLLGMRPTWALLGMMVMPTPTELMGMTVMPAWQDD